MEIGDGFETRTACLAWLLRGRDVLGPVVENTLDTTKPGAMAGQGFG
jgi:hypothetical protein